MRQGLFIAMLWSAPALAGGAGTPPTVTGQPPPAVTVPFPSEDRPVPLAPLVLEGSPVPGAVPVPMLRSEGTPSGPAWWTEFLGRQPRSTVTPPGVPSPEVPEPTITARTIPPPPPRPEGYSDEEIVVWGDRLESAKARVAERLERMGYSPGETRNGRTEWKPKQAGQRWKPRVVVDDDGWFTVHTPTVSSFAPSVQDTTPRAGGFEEAPAFAASRQTPTAGVGGRFAGKRVRMHAEARVVRQVADVVEELAEAHQENALVITVARLPDRLDLIWRGGLDEDGVELPTARDRQEALLALWANRTRTRAGETVRRLIGAYLLAEVDPEVRLAPDLVASAETRCGCRLGDDEGARPE